MSIVEPSEGTIARRRRPGRARRLAAAVASALLLSGGTLALTAGGASAEPVSYCSFMWTHLQWDMQFEAEAETESEFWYYAGEADLYIAMWNAYC
jgi:hypothetical protein